MLQLFTLSLQYAFQHKWKYVLQPRQHNSIHKWNQAIKFTIYRSRLQQIAAEFKPSASDCSTGHLHPVPWATWSLWPLVWLVTRSPESPSIFPSCRTVSYLSDLSGLVKPLRELQDILFPWHVSLHGKFSLVRGKIAGFFLSMKIIKNQVLLWSTVIQIACSSLFSCKY